MKSSRPILTQNRVIPIFDFLRCKQYPQRYKQDLQSRKVRSSSNFHPKLNNNKLRIGRSSCNDPKTRPPSHRTIMKHSLALTLLTSLLTGCHGYDILVLGVFPFGSHLMMLSVISNELVSRGHNVTFVTVKASNPHPNLTVVPVENTIHMGECGVKFWPVIRVWGSAKE